MRALDGGRAAGHFAPHLHSGADLRWIMNRVVLALVPCLVAGVLNTGLQANLAIQGLGLERAPGWRGDLLGRLGIGNDPSSAWDCLWLGLLFALPIYAVAALTIEFWQRLFARLRGRPLQEGGSVTALVFTLILPPAAPLWQVVLGMTFGVVVGKEIFGGTGKNFINPSVLGLAFLYLAYPTAMAGDPLWTGIAGYGGTTIFGTVAAQGMEAVLQSGLSWTQSVLGLVQGSLGVTSALACLIGAVVLLRAGAASWRIMAGIAIGTVAAAGLFNLLGAAAAPIFAMPWYWHLSLGSLAFGAVFLATDPVSAAATVPGRWIYGLVIGLMVVLIRVANPVHPDGVVLAILFGNIFAPLIDYAVIWVNMRRRAGRDA